MEETRDNNICLRLNSPSSCTRTINVESCLLDEQRQQIRAELVTKRTDYEREDCILEIQRIITRLTIQLKDNSITEAEFSMPVSGFPNVCENMPLGPDLLIGLKIEKGITSKINELYKKELTCSDLQILLQAMIRLMPAISAINGLFRLADESLPAKDVPNAMETMSQIQNNVCHAYSDREGSIKQSIAKGEYDKVLSRIGNRISRRWINFKSRW